MWDEDGNYIGEEDPYEEWTPDYSSDTDFMAWLDGQNGSEDVLPTDYNPDDVGTDAPWNDWAYNPSDDAWASIPEEDTSSFMAWLAGQGYDVPQDEVAALPIDQVVDSRDPSTIPLDDPYWDTVDGKADNTGATGDQRITVTGKSPSDAGVEDPTEDELNRAGGNGSWTPENIGDGQHLTGVDEQGNVVGTTDDGAQVITAPDGSQHVVNHDGTTTQITDPRRDPQARPNVGTSLDKENLNVTIPAVTGAGPDNSSKVVLTTLPSGKIVDQDGTVIHDPGTGGDNETGVKLPDGTFTTPGGGGSANPVQPTTPVVPATPTVQPKTDTKTGAEPKADAGFDWQKALLGALTMYQKNKQANAQANAANAAAQHDVSYRTSLGEVQWGAPKSRLDTIQAAPRAPLAVLNPPTPPKAMAQGGLAQYVSGGSGGQADDVNARLSHGEYVFDADTVAALGDGNNQAGAAALDQMRVHIRKHKRSAPANKIPPKAKAPMAYLKGASK